MAIKALNIIKDYGNGWWAIYMNSKWTKPVSYFGDLLEYAYLMDDRLQDKKVNKDYFKFAYDYSILQDTKEILLRQFLS